ncbi:hypothetical protein [Szabonella alba]|uniref:Uncharacterized protein n=1 Tax=Szabonella alba TaxID=2804194 RepID=A0A8K0Y1B3_9RHOB|nr:hypothetical protein [Szabonella alba]MBL4917702.1 hypothetical protein [Szabonella alba]
MNFLRWPGEAKPLHWVTLLTSAVTVWVGAAVLGIVVAQFARLLSDSHADLALMAGGIGLVLLFSPLYSWIGFLIALPFEYWLARRQFFGWGMALLLGTAIGAVLTPILDTILPLFMGGPMLVLQWLVIATVERGRTRFAPPPADSP